MAQTITATVARRFIFFPHEDANGTEPSPWSVDLGIAFPVRSTVTRFRRMPEAEAFFRTLDRKNLYSIYHRLQTAKRPETRARRMQAILQQLVQRERFH